MSCPLVTTITVSDIKLSVWIVTFSFFFQAEDGIRDHCVTGVQTCALPISLGPDLFVLTTPPPGSVGGIGNAIVGSLIMAGAGTLIGTPIGIMAGIYLGEFGSRGWLAPATRFINDILLSAPSIVIRLFVYEV